MVAFITSLFMTGAMLGIAVSVGRRRPPGTPLTWGEAFVAATFALALMFLAYGVVPHQWLTWSGNELKWRSDAYGIPTGPLHSVFGTHRLFAEGISFGGRGRVLITLQAIGDIIATVIYAVMIGVQVKLWSWWQRRGKQVADVREITSAFGRPLLKKA